MGTIISSGVGSGLDLAGLVRKLVEAEGAPKTLQLNQAEAKVQSKLSALGSLRSSLAAFRDALSGLKDASRFQARQATLSVPDFVSASAGTSAVPGSYTIEVERLASAHKLQSPDQENASSAIGTGTLHISTYGLTFDVEIDAENNTLAGIAAAINASAAGERVLATVINGAEASRLTITARNTGAVHAIEITQSGGDGGLTVLTSEGGLTEIDGALDARAYIDGLLVTSATNVVASAIEGVELTLIAANEEGDNTRLTVGYDRAAGRAAVDRFVSSYNTLIDALKSLTSYNVETRQGAPLFGDTGVRNLADQLRRELASSVAGVDEAFDTLSEIGITVQLDGKLAVDSADLDAAFEADYDAIGRLFGTETTGVAARLDSLLEPYLGFQGIFDSRVASLRSSIDAINERREALNVRLEALHARYTRQFNALDGLLAQLQGTSNFLAQQLSNLPGSAPLNRNQR